MSQGRERGGLGPGHKRSDPGDRLRRRRTALPARLGDPRVHDWGRLTGPDHAGHAGRVVAVVVDPVVFEKLLQDAAVALDRAELAIARDEDDYIPWEQVKVDVGLS